MLSDVLIIKMGQYIPLDPLTTLNGMMINYIIKRSCAAHLWAWDLKLKIKQQRIIIISCLKTSSVPVGKYVQGSSSGIIPVHVYMSKIFRKPSSLCFYSTSCCILWREIPREKSSKLDFWFHYMSISFQNGVKGDFPTTLAATSWKPPPAFLAYVKRQSRNGVPGTVNSLSFSLTVHPALTQGPTLGKALGHSV